MTNGTPRGELPRIVLGVLALCLLLVTTVWILSPFLLALVWATMIAVATWPLLLGAQKRLRNSRALAVLLMTVGMLMVMIVPLLLAVTTIVEHHVKVKEWLQQLTEQGLPAPPELVGSLPLVGGKAAAMRWRCSCTLAGLRSSTSMSLT